MVERIRITNPVVTGGNYFAQPKKHIEFISSGSTLLDCALGGGWAEGRISNVIGDKAVGKTLLMIEAAANFARKYPKSKIRYKECEAAFDEPYAEALGMPLDQVDFGEPLETVEDMFEDMTQVIEKAKGPELYICDSLDALSDRAEMERDMDQGTYGAEKAKKLSQYFRRTVSQASEKKITMLIVSQVRSKIGVTFGKTTTRTGGRALDFYASQIVTLSHIGTSYKTVMGTRRASGIEVKAKVDKNKVGLPYREAQFELVFGFGIDDVAACLEWLKEVKGLDAIDVGSTQIKEFLRELNRMGDKDYWAEVKRVHKAVKTRWYEVEEKFMPTRRKYQ